MKALHVWERIFHYVKVWLFVAALGLVAFMLFSLPGAYVLDETEEAVKSIDIELFVQAFGFAMFPLLCVGGAVFAWVLEHIFKKCQVIRGKDKACCCKCEGSCGDVAVEKIMKWKDLYNEGIITEREFIVKRNEILGLHK